MTRIRKFREFSLAVTILAAAAGGARAGDVSGRVECNRATLFCRLDGLALRGEIDDVATAKLSRLLEELDLRSAPDIDRGTTQIKLDSPGGSVNAAMAIGRLMRKYRMAALVEPNTVCASACVLIYEPQAVRNAYTAMLLSIRTYLEEMNVSPQLADEMLKTPPASVRYLSGKEQERFGLSVIDPIERETSSLLEAQQLGLDRREYNRREALTVEKCPADSDFANCYRAVMGSGHVPLQDLSQFGTPVE